jgi:pimeloyl-ACP methyl ester carboxylesterase
LVKAPTLLLWGAQDRILPRSYADRFASAIRGRTDVKVIDGAGHLAELDKPVEVAAAVLTFTA